MRYKSQCSTTLASFKVRGTVTLSRSPQGAAGGGAGRCLRRWPTACGGETIERCVFAATTRTIEGAREYYGDVKRTDGAPPGAIPDPLKICRI